MKRKNMIVLYITLTAHMCHFSVTSKEQKIPQRNKISTKKTSRKNIECKKTWVAIGFFNGWFSSNFKALY
jgi:hypothetical protein